MPTITVERLRSEGPFPIRASYRVDGREGEIISVRRTGPNHLSVTVELGLSASEADELADRAGDDADDG
jgi:hypothetical protein